MAEFGRLANFASLNDLLRDRIVCGINDVSIQRRLLSERATKLTFDKVLEIATSIEAARSHIGELQSGCPQPAEVHKVAAVASQEGVSCYTCGAKGHLADKCKFKGSKCFLCGKIGHIQKACRSSSGNQRLPLKRKDKPNYSTAHTILDLE